MREGVTNLIQDEVALLTRSQVKEPVQTFSCLVHQGIPAATVVALSGESHHLQICGVKVVNIQAIKPLCDA